VVFAKTQFPQAILNLRRRTQLLDSDSHPCLDSAQWANLTAGLISGLQVSRLHPIHNLRVEVSRLGRPPTTHQLSFNGHNLQHRLGKVGPAREAALKRTETA
jgi:hypothetical protein